MLSAGHNSMLIHIINVLELTVPNRRERRKGEREGGESSAVERGVEQVEMSKWEVRPLALMPLGTYIDNGYLHV